VSAAGSWLNLPKSAAEPATRLFCLPYAGGGASAYRDWPARLPDTIGVIAVQPPGRESRFGEPPIAQLPVYVSQLAEAVRPLVDRPYAVFGHSLGARVAFELCRLLRRDGLPLPARLYLSGCPAPQLPAPPPRWDLPDDELIDSLRDLGGTPPEVLASPQLLSLFLPVLRADFALVETFPYAEAPPLPVPIRGFAGRSDPEAPPESVQAWAPHTTEWFELHEFDGDHFFLHDQRTALLRVLAADLAAVRTTA
jgi:medium-chain acyl-[acyl-carrier-protein] hydrolase